MVKGLYIHIPFCEKICHYCDFQKYVASTSIQTEYVEMLLKEISFYQNQLSQVETVFIGGGTPSFLSLKDLEKILCKLEEVLDFSIVTEFTIESNPSDVSLEFIALIQKYNVNRLSIGVQTFQNHLLKILGRNHECVDVYQAVENLKRSNFDNYNFDLIYAIPMQKLEDLEDDLSQAFSLKPTHLSLYSLILEEKTVLFHQVQKNEIELINEDDEMDMVEVIHRRMEKTKFHQYEISNYALPGRESKHNLLYWNLDEYLGLGLGSSSLVNGIRFKNAPTLKQYFEQIHKLGNGFWKEEDCNMPQEFLMLGLRKTNGISLIDFKRRFQRSVFDFYPELLIWIEKRFLVQNDDRLFFSEEGRYLSNQVLMSLF